MITAEDQAALNTHRWQWDEGSAGVTYEFCTRCGLDFEFCEANDYHPAIACTGEWGK